MTTYTAAPNQTNLTLNSGDTLNVLQGGTAADTYVPAGANLNVSGGTALDTNLNGGVVTISSGTISGIIFSNEFTALHDIDTLFVGDPTSLQGTLTFTVPVLDQYQVQIEFDDPINSISSSATARTLTVNYGQNQSVTYNYKALDYCDHVAAPTFILNNNAILVWWMS
jgi:autotransporter passenger strand-loop-strand repeat protein